MYRINNYRVNDDDEDHSQQGINRFSYDAMYPIVYRMSLPLVLLSNSIHDLNEKSTDMILKMKHNSKRKISLQKHQLAH